MEEKQTPDLSIEQLEYVGSNFVNFMKKEYDSLKTEYHKDENIKKMMDLPSYCFTMFVIAIKSYEEARASFEEESRKIEEKKLIDTEFIKKLI